MREARKRERGGGPMGMARKGWGVGATQLVTVQPPTGKPRGGGKERGIAPCYHNDSTPKHQKNIEKGGRLTGEVETTGTQLAMLVSTAKGVEKLQNSRTKEA